MPAANPKDQRRARNAERDLRDDVLAGLAHRAMLDWFEAQPKCVRHSFKLIIKTAKHDKASLVQRIASEVLPRLPHSSAQVSSTTPSPPALENNPRIELHTGKRQIQSGSYFLLKMFPLTAALALLPHQASERRYSAA
ncbi:hypothetical protein RhiJN_16094 [Ceratobasidium sp. AG-Ba]|nr:hypothetical protein RhiJN_16094 [Ceratobasidium sp. AG-Ba]